MTKSDAPEVIVPAATPEVPALADDRNVYIYAVEGGRIKLSKATGKTAKDRPLVFEPSASAMRYTVEATVARAWLAETDADARTALLSDASFIETASAIRPDAGLWHEAQGLMREAAAVSGVEPVELLRSLLASGFAVIPAKVRKDRAAKAATDNTDAVLAELFA